MSWVWWCILVIPGLREFKAGRLQVRAQPESLCGHLAWFVCFSGASYVPATEDTAVSELQCLFKFPEVSTEQVGARELDRDLYMFSLVLDFALQACR